MVMGGVCVPLAFSAAFESDLLSCRDETTPLFAPSGELSAMKWQKVSNKNLSAYKRLVDAYFTFPKRIALPAKFSLDTHCIAVDTSRKTLKRTGEGNIEVGYAIEFYFLCVPTIGNRLKTGLFHLYPDRRTTNQNLANARDIMNSGARKYSNRTDWPYRELRFEDPECWHALQLVDVLIGAIAYRLNGHYESRDANPAKRKLCDHVLNWAKIKDPSVNTEWFRKRLTILHRDGTERKTRK